MYKKNLIIPTLVCLGTLVVTVFVIYFTPLKWVNLNEPKIKDISPKEFQGEFAVNPDKYMFIDVRSPSAYTSVHAEESVNMPLHTLYTKRLTLPKNDDKTIVLICSGGAASGIAYHYLQHFGFFNIRRIDGGIEQWALDGLPLEGDVAALNLLK